MWKLLLHYQYFLSIITEKILKKSIISHFNKQLKRGLIFLQILMKNLSIYGYLFFSYQ